MALIRSFLLAALGYGAVCLAYPDWSGEVYHAVAFSCIAGGAVGIFFLEKILDLGSGFVKFALEAAFVLGVAFMAAYTMPQKSGKPPIQQWAEGIKPDRAAARRGLERMGIDPSHALAKPVVALFPR